MQGDQVLGSILFTPESCRSYITKTSQNAPSSGVSTQGVLYLQSTGYIPSVQVYTKCVRAAVSLCPYMCYSSKCIHCPSVVDAQIMPYTPNVYQT